MDTRFRHPWGPEEALAPGKTPLVNSFSKSELHFAAESTFDNDAVELSPSAGKDQRLTLTEMTWGEFMIQQVLE